MEVNKFTFTTKSLGICDLLGQGLIKNLQDENGVEKYHNAKDAF